MWYQGMSFLTSWTYVVMLLSLTYVAVCLGCMHIHGTLYFVDNCTKLRAWIGPATLHCSPMAHSLHRRRCNCWPIVMWLNYASFGASTIQVHHSSSSFKAAAHPIDTLVYIPHSGVILGRLPATFVVLYSDDAAPRHNQAHSLFVILIEYQVKYIQTFKCQL